MEIREIDFEFSDDYVKLERMTFFKNKEIIKIKDKYCFLRATEYENTKYCGNCFFKDKRRCINIVCRRGNNQIRFEEIEEWEVLFG